jgi:hypothetical protein
MGGMIAGIMDRSLPSASEYADMASNSAETPAKTAAKFDLPSGEKMIPEVPLEYLAPVVSGIRRTIGGNIANLDGLEKAVVLPPLR